MTLYLSLSRMGQSHPSYGATQDPWSLIIRYMKAPVRQVPFAVPYALALMSHRSQQR